MFEAIARNPNSQIKIEGIVGQPWQLIGEKSRIAFKAVVTAFKNRKPAPAPSKPLESAALAQSLHPASRLVAGQGGAIDQEVKTRSDIPPKPTAKAASVLTSKPPKPPGPRPSVSAALPSAAVSAVPAAPNKLEETKIAAETTQSSASVPSTSNAKVPPSQSASARRSTLVAEDNASFEAIVNEKLKQARIELAPQEDKVVHDMLENYLQRHQKGDILSQASTWQGKLSPLVGLVKAGRHFSEIAAAIEKTELETTAKRKGGSGKP